MIGIFLEIKYFKNEIVYIAFLDIMLLYTL